MGTGVFGSLLGRHILQDPPYSQRINALRLTWVNWLPILFSEQGVSGLLVNNDQNRKSGITGSAVNRRQRQHKNLNQKSGGNFGSRT